MKKKIVIAILGVLLYSNGLLAQEESVVVADYQPVYSEYPLTYSSSNVYFNGQRLSTGEVRSLLASEEFDLYNKGLKQRKAGNILLWTGVGIASVGVSYVCLGAVFVEIAEDIIGKKDNAYGPMIFGGALTLCGAGILTTGIVLKSTGKKTIQNSINQHNSKTSTTSLRFGVTNNGGIGFTYDF